MPHSRRGRGRAGPTSHAAAAATPAGPPPRTLAHRPAQPIAIFLPVMQSTLVAAGARVQGASASAFAAAASSSLWAPPPRQQQQRHSSRLMPACVAAPEKLQRPDSTGRYGRFGGKYVPETLIVALQQLEEAYREAIADPAFTVRLARMWPRQCRRSLPHLIQSFTRCTPLACRPSWTRCSRTMSAAPRRCTTPSASRRTTAAPTAPAPRSTSSARTSTTRGPTRSTTRWARRCCAAAWARSASSPRRAPGSTAWPRCVRRGREWGSVILPQG